MTATVPKPQDDALDRDSSQDVVGRARRRRKTGIEDRLPPAWSSRRLDAEAQERATLAWRRRAGLEGRATAAVRDLADSRGRWAHVAEVCDVLEGSGDSALVKRGQRLRACSTAWTHWATASGQARLTPQRCDDRLCPACSYHRGRRVRDLVASQVEAGERVRFVTFTQRSVVGEPAAAGRARIVAHWRTFWREVSRRKDGRLVGGLRRVEVTWSNGAWHWHLHVLAVGAHWERDALAAEWAACAPAGVPPPDPRVCVDIRAVKGSAKSAAELSKYALKSANIPAAHVLEFARATRGLRDVATFGTWYRLSVEPTDPAATEDGEVWEVVPGHAVEVLARAVSSGPSEEELAAAAELERVLYAPRTWREWRTWAYGVRLAWLAQVREMECAAEDRAAGRDLRARQRALRRSDRRAGETLPLL